MGATKCARNSRSCSSIPVRTAVISDEAVSCSAQRSAVNPSSARGTDASRLIDSSPAEREDEDSLEAPEQLSVRLVLGRGGGSVR